MKEKTKDGRYKRVIAQLEELIPKTDNLTSRCSTIVAILHHKFEYFFWTGFYFLQNNKLLVGSYQGPVACQELEKNKGVCWAGINQKETIVVPDVHKFPGHIACDSRSKSEIVIPVYNASKKIIGVMDIDSKDLASFDEVDAKYLRTICDMISM